MHEMSIAMGIIEIAEKQVRQAGAHLVREIEIEVGDLSGVEYDTLVKALEIAVQKTILEKAKIKINRKVAEAHCSECTTVFNPKSLLDSCPKCSSYLYQLKSGKELRVKSLVVD